MINKNNEINSLNFDLEIIQGNIGSYIAGFVDGDGSFCISFYKKKMLQDEKISWKVILCFAIAQKERLILEFVKKHLTCGYLYTNKKGITSYMVTNKTHISNIIVPFFKKYGFISTKKKRDFLAFCEVLKILEKQRLTKKDIEEILALRINTPVIVAKRRYSDKYILDSLSEDMQVDIIEQFSETDSLNSEEKAIITEIVNSDLGDYTEDSNSCFDEVENLNLYSIEKEALNIYSIENYFVGFCDGEGSLNVSFTIRNDYILGWKISPSFSVSQRDKELLIFFKKKISCGTIRKGSSEGLWCFEVLNRKDLQNKILPFFNKYPFISERKIDQFERFCKIVKILQRMPRTRSDIVEILKLRKSVESKNRWTDEEILNRVDERLKKRNEKLS